METKRERCKKCGFRVRGRDHEKGDHHKLGVDGRYGVKKG